MASPAAVAGSKAKGKPRKQFRVPGDRRPSIDPMTVAPRPHEVLGLNDGVLMVRSTGVSAGADAVDGAAEIAEALLTAGILRESDWCGGVERTIRAGLDRWINDEVGMRHAKVLRSLSLVYADDCLAFSGGMRMNRWREDYRARPDRPIGFFGFRTTSMQPRAVFVKDRVLELEAVYPGYGYMMICMLSMTFMSNVNGMTFWWARQMLEGLRAARERHRYCRWSESPELQALADRFGIGGGFDETALTIAQFDDYIPKEASTTEFRLPVIMDFATKSATSTDPALRRHAAFGQRIVDLWNACREGGKRFHATNHRQFISWESTQQVPGHPELGTRILSRKALTGAATVVTVWDERDPMRRMADDYIQALIEEMQYCDLTWMHAFQVGFSGGSPRDFVKHEAAKDRMLRKARKKAPDTIAWEDPDFITHEMLDGSVMHGAQALQSSAKVLKCLDDVLYYLSGGEL